jgi:hypothetical protein
MGMVSQATRYFRRICLAGKVRNDHRSNWDGANSNIKAICHYRDKAKD